jgi:hypothetical protein
MDQSNSLDRIPFENGKRTLKLSGLRIEVLDQRASLSVLLGAGGGGCCTSCSSCCSCCSTCTSCCCA